MTATAANRVDFWRLLAQRKLEITQVGEGQRISNGKLQNLHRGFDSRRRLSVSGAFAAGLGWSSDGASLAIKRLFAQPSVQLVPAVGGSEIPVADGDMVSWRARAPELLIGATMLGGQVVRIQTYDMATKTVREVHRVERSILRDLQWHPTADRFIYGQDEPGIIGRSPAFELWQRNADGSQATLIEMPNGRQIATLCRQGGTPPDRCT